ncbi:alpha-E domain-containing protein [Ectothiorhodospiraceae bacterium 2226]|nr:alpha-E domain-containing protein [Ectothiorhodospiraceae bacterium 2226]
MLSRVAEHLYWMARYAERAENSARLVNVNTHLLLDLPRGTRFGWEPLIDITGNDALFNELYPSHDERSVVKFLLADTRHPGALLNSLQQARENARTVRDIIPREAWEQVNDLYLSTKAQLPQALARARRYDFLKGVISGVQLLTGLLAGTMSHDAGYSFIRLGRNLERGDMTTRIIDVRSATLLPEAGGELPPFESIQWMSVLKSLSAYQMYRRLQQVRVQRGPVLNFLLQDRAFPRAFYHCLCEVQGCLQDLPQGEPALRVVTHLQRVVRDANPEHLDQQALHALMDTLQLGLGDVHEQIRQRYFIGRSE